jgi:phospholipase/carboxylesterase
MAYAAGLMEPKSIHGIVALSGYIPHKSGLPLQLRDLQSLAVFISHGSYDQIIPVQFGRESADLLKRARAAVAYHEYEMGHEVRQETLRDLAAWTHYLLS